MQRVAERTVERDQPPAAGPQIPPPDRPPATARGSRVKELLAVFAGYLALSVFVWWGLWSSGGRTTCPCGDSSTFVWYLEWPAYAIAHGLSPFYSPALFHPQGIDLLSNTSVTAVGVPLAPITWIFGPVTTFNVAVTLSAPLSALALYWLVRRWVSWWPAAFAAGLFYGFSPFIIGYLGDGHLMLGLAIVPPLVVGCLEELLVRQRGRPLVLGAVLGVLVVVQFLIGTEVLLIMAGTAAFGVALVVLYGLVADRAAVAARVGFALRGLAAAAVTAAVLVAYPLWFALAGPAHLSGPIWPGSIFAFGGTPLSHFLLPTAPFTSALFGSAYFHRLGGYQGPILSTDYLGLGLVVVAVVGTIVWWRDRKLWLFGAVAVVSVAVALGWQSGFPTPWRWLMKLPQFDNVIPERWVLMAFLAGACMLGIVADHARAAVLVPRRRRRRRHSLASSNGRSRRGSRRAAAAGVGAAVAAAALVPTVAYLSQSLPMTTQPSVVPAYFRTVGPTLDSKQVLLVVPNPLSAIKGADFWQAAEHDAFTLVGGPGPEGVPQRAGRERLAQSVVVKASTSPDPTATLTTADVEALRRALGAWGVTEVVVPDQPQLPEYDLPGSVTGAAAVMTAATGRLPTYQQAAWVWHLRATAPPAPVPAAAQVDACTGALSRWSPDAVRTATRCVLQAAGTA